jgi:hypothetical protein
MERRSIFAIAVLLVTTLAAADGAWKWTDDNGVVHYSDVPVEGAEQVNIAEYSRATGANLSRNSAPSSNAATEAESAAAPGYASISISSPAAEETLWNIEGRLTVSVNVSPGLQSGHQIRAYYDGQAQIVQGTTFTIDEVFRGVHNLQVEVIDGSGKLMIRSQPNRFYVQQNVVTR